MTDDPFSGLLTSEREALMRHRANAVTSALWGLYRGDPKHPDSRRWIDIAPRVLQGGAGGGSYLADAGNGTLELRDNRVPTQKFDKPGYLPIRVPTLRPKIKVPHPKTGEPTDMELLSFPQHHIALFRHEFEELRGRLPRVWDNQLQHFLANPYLLAPFGLVVKARLQSASFRVNTHTTDGLHCTALLLAEIASGHTITDIGGRVHFM